MSIRAIATVGSWCLVATAGCASSSNNAQPDAGDHSITDAGVNGDAIGDGAVSCGNGTLKAGSFSLVFKGHTYGYIVHVPPGFDVHKATPLVLNWHGYTSTAQQEEFFSEMDPVSDAKGFLLVYPNSPDMSWNAGTCCGSDTRDDIGFAVALVDELKANACIDAKRVYSTGMSNGAFMSYALGCRHAETFAAIAPVAGKVGVPNCDPSRPVPLLAFHGTLDPLVSYDGGALSADNQSVPETVQSWATRNGCTAGPTTTYQMGTVTCQEYSSCDAGATATLCSAVGEGHCWPGDPSCPYGAATTDINASSTIGDFFAKFSLP